MQNTFLVITSIANDTHPILKDWAEKTTEKNIQFIVVGDTKSPENFELEGCDFYDVERQKALPFSLKNELPYRHYARKNLGYLAAIAQGAEIIIETDDDNLALENFWNERENQVNAHVLRETGWLNTYKYFTKQHIWPRGFSLEHILQELPVLDKITAANCPIQQGLADENPDIDAIYRLVLPLPFSFDAGENIALGEGAFCPFNSQNTTWFKEAFALLYLPSYCSFRMTDIWRSFVAQRIAWTCDWHVLFHQSTVRQERNDHRLLHDFEDEISGYLHNDKIFKTLQDLKLEKGTGKISENLKFCYHALIDLNLIGSQEMLLLEAWINDLRNLKII